MLNTLYYVFLRYMGNGSKWTLSWNISIPCDSGDPLTGTASRAVYRQWYFY